MKRFLFKFFFVLFALIAALPAQAVTVFVKGSTSPYVKVGDSYQQLTSSVTTSDNVTWYYADVADNSTISFATDNNGSKASPSFTVTTGSAYFYYDGNSNAVNMTDMKDKASYCLLEVSPNYWGKDGAIFKISDSKNENIAMTAIGGNGTDKYVYLYAQNDYTVADNTSITFKRCKPSDGSQWNYYNTPYYKGAYYLSINNNDWNSGSKTDATTYQNIVWPESPQLAAPTFSLAEGEYTSAQTVTISAAEGATIYYTTDKSDPTTSTSRTEYSEPITVSETTTIRAIAVKDGYTNSEIAEATYTINSTTPTKYTYALHGQITGNTQWESTAMTDEGNGIWSLTGNFVVGEFGIRKMDADGNQVDWLGSPYIGSPADNCVQSGSNIKLTVAGNYTISFNTKTEKITVTKNSTSTGDIPVYPAGVNSETELSAYNFEANPVYYLLSTILNNNRVTPEWQMTKGADGKYHLNGFAMRNTSCRDIDGGKNVEGYIKVRQYVDATTYKEFDKQQVNDLPENPLTDGKLYNATFDPETKKLTLTEDASAKGKMPFISLVGYMMQQDQEYTTPRGIDGKPSGTTTAKGWQEAWLQYDANGKLLKDRKGNVMYSTMWPPKNPVYFTATVGENQRLYSSDQMTFVPVKDAKGDYVGKTGAEWEKELKALDAEAYKGLKLDGSKIYYRYVVSDIWYVGAGKIWTGWGSQITYSSNNPIAQWYNHTNWGYLNKKSNDTDGSLIDPETTYGVSTKDGENGNFLFENPTYFKTFEFFYENETPSTNSKIYTTRAYGSASIAAQSNKDKKDGAYKKGSYQPSVSVPEGVTVTGYTIYRYDATTNQLAPIGDDGGKVAEGKTNPNSDTFTSDNEGLADGRYYYVLKVDFSNGRSSKVRSNPFIIYHPGVYTLDANGYQLVKLDNPVNDYEYVTYNSKENGEMYLVNIANDAVTAYEVLPTDKRDAVKALLSSNEGIKWTDKVFVYAPVPSSFKIDAEKDNSTINLEDITGYTLGTTTVAPFNANAKELVKLDNTGNFAQRTYKAVMNYEETDPNHQDVKTPKSTLGKENITMMQMPNVKAKGSVVNVAKIENSEVLDIIDGDATKKKACNYYEVTLALNFDDPNVITAKAPRFKIGDKVYEGLNAGTHSITIACVNPLDFANAADITVDAVYYDGSDYTLPANIGEAAVLKADDAKFQVLADPKITSVHAITSKMPREHVVADVVAVTEMHTTMTGADKIGETALDDEYYNVEFAIDDHTTPDFSQILTREDINFTGKLVFKEDGKYWIWDKFHWFENTTGKNNMKFRAEVTPMYVAHVTNQASTENLQIISGETPATAKGTYVALNGIKADYTIEGSITTGVTDINTLAPRARKVIENGEIHIICGDRKYNVMGAEIR